MHDIIKDELREGEKVLWSGSPEAFETLDATCKVPFIRRGIIITICVLAVCAIYISYSLSNGIALKPVLIAAAIACALLGSFSFYFQAKKLRGAVYVITNQRLMSVMGFPKFVEFSQIVNVQFKTDADGHTSLLCGNNSINAKAHAWRDLALTDPYIDQETGICERFVFYAIPDPDKVKKILCDFLTF